MTFMQVGRPMTFLNSHCSWPPMKGLQCRMFQAPVILWNFETCQLVSQYDSHKFCVASVTFSCDSKYLISLGGHDDNNIIVWNVEEREAVCGKCHSFLLPVVFLFVFIDGCKVSNLFLPSFLPILYVLISCRLSR